jgi:hypothetical protein
VNEGGTEMTREDTVGIIGAYGRTGEVVARELMKGAVETGCHYVNPGRKYVRSR